MELQDQKSPLSCYNCKKPLFIEENKRVLRSEECPSCYTSIHSCMMCHFYDINSYNHCLEPNAERILDKEKANFCDYFELKQPDNGSNNSQSTFEAANSLFKD